MIQFRFSASGGPLGACPNPPTVRAEICWGVRGDPTFLANVKSFARTQNWVLAKDFTLGRIEIAFWFCFSEMSVTTNGRFFSDSEILDTKNTLAQLN